MSVQRRETKAGVRYDVRLRDPAGHVYTRTFRTKREAQTFEARELADRSRSAWVDPRRSDVTFGLWAKEWLSSDPAKRSSSRARDESILRNHLLPVLGDRPLSSLSPRDIQAVVNHWAAEGAPRTVRRQYDVLRAILNAAVGAERLVRTPCRGIKLPALVSTERHVVSVEELVGLAEAVDIQWQPMVYLGAVLGLRWGECAGLRVGRLDFLNRTLTVAEQRTRGLGGLMVSGAPKSKAGRRTMSVPVPLMDLLAAHLARRGLSGADPQAWVFVGHTGEPLGYSNWRRRVWLPARERVGLPNLGFHDLRHAAATALVAEGVDLKTAQARLGHSDPRLTLAIYAQATTDNDRAAAALLGARLMPDTTQHRDEGPRDGRAMDTGGLG